MKSTGEAMGIGRTFRAALIKAVRGLDLKRETLTGDVRPSGATPNSTRCVARPTHERLFAVCELLRRAPSGSTATNDRIADRRSARSTAFWLDELAELVALEERLRATPSGRDRTDALASGYGAATRTLTDRRLDAERRDERAARRFAWSTRPPPSFRRSRRTTISRAARRDEMRPTPREAVVVVGSGPIRIGQGIEFDY